MRDDPLTVRHGEDDHEEANPGCRWAAAVVVGLLVTGEAAAQSPPAAKATAPAVAAKPAKKSVPPAFEKVLEPRAMEVLKATSARLVTTCAHQSSLAARKLGSLLPQPPTLSTQR